MYSVQTSAPPAARYIDHSPVDPLSEVTRVLSISSWGALFKKNIGGVYTDKKEKKILLIIKEIQNGAVAKSYMTNGLLIYGEIFAHFLIY